MRNSYLNGAFVFDYTQEKPKLIVTLNDELQWLCVVHNVRNMIGLRELVDDYRDNIPQYNSFVDVDFENYEENLEKSGKSKAEYLADFNLNEKSFEKLKERIFKKYDIQGMTLDFPNFFVDDSQGAYISSNLCGIHPDFNYIFDPEFNYNDLDFEVEPQFVFDYMTNTVYGILEISDNDGILVVNDEMFKNVKDALPTLFQIGAWGHCASIVAEWLPSDVCDDLFRAKGVDGEKFAKNNQLIYEGNDDYKSEYARFLIQRACQSIGDKVEFDLSFDNIAKDSGVLNFLYANMTSTKTNEKIKPSHTEINWNESEDMMRNQILCFYSKHDGSDGIDADFVSSRVYITSSVQSHLAERTAKEIMIKNPDLVFAECSLGGDSFIIDSPLNKENQKNEINQNKRRER